MFIKFPLLFEDPLVSIISPAAKLEEREFRTENDVG